jgi:hypothetical protein
MSSNKRNGKSGKTVVTEDGPLRIDVPRDRDGSFEPLFIPKHERRFTGFDDKILALYGRGMTVREIQGFLRDQYGADVSRPSSSAPRPTPSWPRLAPGRHGRWSPCTRWCSSTRCASRFEKTRSCATRRLTWRLPDDTRDILGLWIDNTEGAKFWLEVCNDLKTLGVEDILIAVTDGLKGIAEALEAVSTATTLQTCTVHLIRGSLSYASCKDRKALAAALSRSTRPPALRRQRLSSMPSGTAPGDRSSTRLLRPGGAPGIGSFPSSRSRPRCAG